MDVYFRADANATIGMGHIMRCLSMADAFTEAGCHARFILADDQVSKIVEKRGYETILLHSDYKKPEEEIDAWPVDITSSVIIVDSYYVTADYFSKINGKTGSGCTVVYVDDLCESAYSVDYLINYNICASKKAYERLYEGMDSVRFLLGTDYTPLRTEFCQLPERHVRCGGSSILISTGGADPEKIAFRLLRQIRQGVPACRSMQLHLIVGGKNDRREEVLELASAVDNATVHVDVENMADLMRSCDVAISAAGSTLYELCATQTPTVTYVLADNQLSAAKEFADQGIMIHAGDMRGTDDGELIEKLLLPAVRLCEDYEKRLEFANRMSKVVDGMGAARICDAILSCIGK